MKIKNNHYFRTTISNLFLRLYHYLQNNNNSEFETNGEKNILKEITKIYKNQPFIFFDIGSHTGNFAEIVIMFAQKYNLKFQGHLFEPLSINFVKLSEKFKSDTVILNQLGISDNECKKIIYFDKTLDSFASLYQRKKLNETEIIVLVTLEKYINLHQISHIHFLKMDIEGHELPAIKGLNKYLNSDFIDFIQFEYGGTYLESKILLRDMISILEENGFGIFKIFPQYLLKFTYEEYLEHFNYSNFLAISNKIYNQI